MYIVIHNYNMCYSFGLICPFQFWKILKIFLSQNLYGINSDFIRVIKLDSKMVFVYTFCSRFWEETAQNVCKFDNYKIITTWCYFNGLRSSSIFYFFCHKRIKPVTWKKVYLEQILVLILTKGYIVKRI